MFVFPLIVLAVAVLIIASMWKVLAKAGQPGWAAIIPIFNLYCFCKAAGKPGWWVILLFIPLVNLVVWFLVLVALSENFGKSAAFAAGLFFLGVIFFPILAFGDAQYSGGSSAAASTPVAAA